MAAPAIPPIWPGLIDAPPDLALDPRISSSASFAA
jgi:hypothetical protein